MNSLSTPSSLLLRLQSREDSAAWNRFLRLYTPLVRYWIAGLGIESNHAEDLLQEVFVSILGKVTFLGQRPPDSFRAWLRTVTLNQCRDHFRRLDRKTYAHALESIEVAIADPQVEGERREYQQYLSHAALRLMKDCFSETTWKACWLSVVERRSGAEIANQLGISENAVYLARGRVLKRLREELDGLWE